jgi:RNA polymerase sigma-70 factor (ECF subfamily)
MERTPAAAGDRAGTIAALFESEAPKVHALARRICGERDADDLVQDTFLNAFRALDQLKDPGNPRPWLYAIAHRACLRMRRPRAGQPNRMETFDELLPRPGATIPALEGLESGPHADRLRHEARELVERGIAELPEAFRVPLLLADIAELRLGEIAAILGLQEATVKTRVHRARLKLRQVLARGLPQRPAPGSTHSRALCLDLLRARLAAFDRGIDVRYSRSELCDRCRAVFATLDLSASVCAALDRDVLSPALRRRVLGAIPPTTGPAGQRGP